VICPPLPFLLPVGEKVKNSKLGAQDVFWENPLGAFTGEISPTQLQSIGVQYVILGHSERRANLEETDEMIGKKVRAVLGAGLTPVLCVGETKEARVAGQREAMIKHQLEAGLAVLKSCSDDLIIAYEPVWAISTNKDAEADTPENAVSAIKFMSIIVKTFCPDSKPKFIYGGSVNSGNVESFLKEDLIEGALVGGASLRPDEIKEIVVVAKKY